MNEFDIKRYIDISDFLSTLLGPDYEIILYDLKHIIYIINGDISGRQTGDMLSTTMKTLLQNKETADKKWI